MGLLNKISKGKDVPDELPDLAIDEVKKNIQTEQSSPEPINKISENIPSQEQKPIQQFPQDMIKSPLVQTTPPPSQTMFIPENKGFFKELANDLLEEAHDAKKLDQWYKETFHSQDLVNKMKDFYEDKKPEMLAKNVGLDIQSQITESVNRLHSLEKEWQEAYFSLLAKEDAIREEENKLRKNLSEFIKLYKQSSKKPKRKKK